MTMNDNPLFLDTAERSKLWKRVIDEIESYTRSVDSLHVGPDLNLEKIHARLRPLKFDNPMDPMAAIELVVGGLREHQIHTSSRRCFGLYVPASSTMGIVADALAAAYNPQLGAWGHCPIGCEVENHVIQALGERFGYPKGRIDGVFASGGTEANHTALLCALVSKFERFMSDGAGALSQRPIVYTSVESHHSIAKATRLSGLGKASVRLLPVDDSQKMCIDSLRDQIAKDIAHGHRPFFVTATAGTTAAGAVDPIPEIVKLARQHDMWVHVDAAWGGAAVLSPTLRPILSGIEQSDSITFDAHKWLSAPMGAGIFLTSHTDIMKKTFAVSADYMPKDADGLDIVEPFNHSMQCSRRFIGLKVFLSLLVAGFDGYAKIIQHQSDMGVLLKQHLAKNKWRIVNDTPLPVVCFVDDSGLCKHAPSASDDIVHFVVSSGKAWISSAKLTGKGMVIRACISNFRTDESDIIALMELLDQARRHVATLTAVATE
jgi:glutamate/tyrosine decarboxylase-like PLP-dependent enzyme